MDYIAIIGDIVQSRKIKKRDEIQQKLWTVLHEINEYYEDEIAADFAITLGDEFQGLLRDPSVVMKVIHGLQQKMYPTKIRFGIGVGTVSTEINPHITYETDGPCYHLARAAIERIRTEEKMNEVSASRIRLEFEHIVPGVDMANSLLMMVSLIMDKWKDKQVRTIEEYENNDRNQLKAANAIGVNRTTVKRSLDAADYYAYYEAQKVLSKFIEENVIDVS